ncbi:MAG: adenylate/guanylate cyclase domain-containing protein [Candidatus Woesearchaeota archaeon]|nr:MAG: adenylate/guanylate cyclase domain-containing protein [Candidatus Woesearchaeota archaeon]
MLKKLFLIFLLLVPIAYAAYEDNIPSYEDIQKDYMDKFGPNQSEIQKIIEKSINDTTKQFQDQAGNISNQYESQYYSKYKPFFILITIVAILVILGFIAKIYLFGKKIKEKKEFSTPKSELAVIMFTDVKSFSKHANKNEKETLDAVWEYEKIMRNLIYKNSGKFIKNIGDAVMATFKNSVDAVNCAKQIQEELKGKKFKIRIGLHLGEVTSKEGDVYGHNVNIAARIEGRAPPGGVAVSEDIYKQVKGKVDYKFKTIGKQELKNIKEPIELYKVV